MKTTLHYNTIEVLREQEAWSDFVDAIVDDCDAVFDDNLIAEIETVEDGQPVKTQKKLSDSQDVLQAKYASLSFPNDVMRLNMLENISLKGLLRVLSVYGCKIKDIELKDDTLPHTYKVEGIKDAGVWGFNDGNRTYDYEARAKKQNDAGNTETDCFEFLTDKNFEEEDTSFKYIYNLYGYNQKNPILSVSDIKEVKKYYEFTRLSDDTALLPKYLYMQESDVYFNSADDYGFFTTFVYKAENNENSGIRVCTDDDLKVKAAGGMVVEPVAEGETPMSLYEIITTYYTIIKPDTQNVPNIVQKWVYTGNVSDENTDIIRETSYVVNDNDKVDLIKDDQRIKYNSVENSKEMYKNVRFALSDESTIEKVNLTKVALLGERETIDPQSEIIDQLKYFIYEDSTYHRYWVIMDSIGEYNRISIRFLKNQLFADESTVKAQPLFVYANGTMSMCANFIGSLSPDKQYTEDLIGGAGKITYEVEGYDTSVVRTTATAWNNLPTEPDFKRIVDGVSYGEYLFKWEQYGYRVNEKTDEIEKAFFYRDVYTVQNFDKLPKPESIDLNSLDYFFDGEKKSYFVDYTKTDYNNNKVKVLNEYLYENTLKQEFLETMFFNHFVLVYPIVDTESDSPVTTMKLYCDNLELVEYGDIVPYIVSYDRIAEPPTNGEEFDDLDCSVFSRILSYNKHTHLITVNNPVSFEDSKTPKFVVVAYQNASPFNKTKALYITAPNSEIKDVVSGLLEDYENDNCMLNLFTEDEYEDYVDEKNVDEIKRTNESIVNNTLNTLEMKFSSNKFLFGNYDITTDPELIIRVKVKPKTGVQFYVVADKSNGYFEFSADASGNIRQTVQTLSGNTDSTPHSINDIDTVTFAEGKEIITSVCFGDVLKNQTFGSGLFDGLVRLQVIANFKPKYHNGNETSLWRAWDFEDCKKLLYFNPRTMSALAQDTKSMKNRCPMFSGTKIKNVNFYDINWGVNNTVIDINLDAMFKDCEYLENVNFKLKNGNKFRVTSAKEAFKNCKFLKNIDLSSMDFSLIQNTESMFEGCIRLETINVDWGSNNVIGRMRRMFYGCRKLKSYGTFNRWKPVADNDLRSMFEGCGIETLEWKSTFTTIAAESIFDNCKAKTLNINFIVSQTSARSLMGLNMPNLTSITGCANLVTASSWSRNGSNPRPFVLNTPQLSKSSFDLFVSKQTRYEEGDYMLLKIHENIFKKLKIGTDLTDNGDYYSLTLYPYIRIVVME